MMRKSNLTEPQLKRIYDFINLVYAQDSINIGIKTIVTHSNNLKDDLNPIPIVKVETKLVKEKTIINVTKPDEEEKVFRQNGKVLKIGDWYYDINDGTYNRWRVENSIYGEYNENGLPDTPILIKEPPKGHKAWNDNIILKEKDK